MPPALKKTVMGCATSLLTLAVLFLIGEVYYRHKYALLTTDFSAANSHEFFIFDEELGWKGRPSISKLHGSGAHITHNEHGFRDTPWDLDTDKTRVLMLGDSNFWGYGVEDDEYPAALLNRMTPNIRWFNAGMNGYGTDQEVLMFRRLQPLIQPDWVVLAVSDNDRSDNTSRRVRGYEKPFFKMEGDRLVLMNSPVPRPETKSPNPIPDLSLRVLRRTGSRFLFHLTHLYEQWRGRARVSRIQKTEDLTGDPTHPLIRELFQAMNRRLLVAAITRDDALAAFCEKEGIPFLDLSATPAAQPGPHCYPSGPPKFSHWTPEGNRIAAEEIARRMRELWE